MRRPAGPQMLHAGKPGDGGIGLLAVGTVPATGVAVTGAAVTGAVVTGAAVAGAVVIGAIVGTTGVEGSSGSLALASFCK